jgi:signal transduction histidine kinase
MGSSAGREAIAFLTARRGSLLVLAVGVCLGGIGGWQVAEANVASGPANLGFRLFVNVALPVAVGAGVVYATRRNHVEEAVLARWTVGGLVAIGLLGAWASSGEIVTGDFAEARGSLVLGANLGLMFGAVAGLNRSRAIANARLAERERTQREGIAFLNHLLRHHVLNGMTIIEGYTDELREDDVSEADLAVIERQSDRIVTLVENVQTLVESMSGEIDVQPVAVEAVAERAVADLRETYPEATVELEAEPATAAASDLLRSGVDNLLVNAVEHNPSDGFVRLTVEAGDPVVVSVEDDGPGIPERIKASYESGDDTAGVAGDGMGLYLVHALVESYGGEVHIADRDPEGTTVRIELPAA